MIRLRKLLLATDFAESSTFALEYARELTAKFGAELHVLHVVADIGQAAVGAPGVVMDVGEIQLQIEKDAGERLASLLNSHDRQALHAVTVCRTARNPADAIVAYANEAGIDAIVVGSHGRKGLSHLFVGSVAERVVHAAACPVVVVKMRSGR